MTISPVAAPSPGPTRGAQSDSASSSSDFASLVEQHLAAADRRQDRPGQSRPDQRSSDQDRAGRLEGQPAHAVIDAASDPTAVPSDGLAALIARMLAPGTTATSAGEGGVGTPEKQVDQAAGVMSGPALQVDAGSAESTIESTSWAAADAAGAGTGSAVVVGAGNILGAGAYSDAAAGSGSDAAGAAGVVQAVSRGTSASSDTTGQTAATTGAATTATGSGAQSSAAADPTSTDQTTTGATGAQPADPSDTDAGTKDAPGAQGLAGATAAGGSLAATRAEAANGAQTIAAQQAQPVADQVFSQVTRLVTRGNGTHVLTLRLHPADLGEVKVVLTVRNDAVDVTLSAGPEAREALQHGSHHLRSLLELGGATAASVVVRDLGAAPPPAASTTLGGSIPPGSAFTGSGQDSSGPGAGETPHQHTAHGDDLARDGGGPPDRRPAQPDHSSRIDLDL